MHIIYLRHMDKTIFIKSTKSKQNDANFNEKQVSSVPQKFELSQYKRVSSRGLMATAEEHSISELSQHPTKGLR